MASIKLRGEEPLDPELQAGHVLEFRAPLEIGSEVVELYFFDVTKSHVRCQQQGCVLRVTFSDSEALQRALDVSSYTIKDEGVLTLLSRATTIPSSVTNAAHPTNCLESSAECQANSLLASAAPQAGEVDGKPGLTTVVLTMNIDCHELITKYFLKDLNSYLSVSRCVIRSSEVPGVLLVQYDASTSQFDADQIVKQVHEYARKFTAIVVALPEHHAEKKIKHILHSCNALVCCSLVGRFSETHLYKICCETTYASELQLFLSDTTMVPLISAMPSASACGNVCSKRREEYSCSDAVCAVKCEPPTSDTITKGMIDLAPSDVPSHSVVEPNRVAMPDATTRGGTDATSVAAAAQTASHTDSLVPKGLPTIDSLASSTSAGLLTAGQHNPQRSRTVAFSTTAVDNAAISSTAREHQQAAAPSELGTSYNSSARKILVPMDNAKGAPSQGDRSYAAADDVPKAADRKRHEFEANTAMGSTLAQMPIERSRDKLTCKTGDEVELLSAATSDRGAPDDHRRKNELAVSTDERSTLDCLMLQLEEGSVAEQRADVLVNSVDRKLTLSEGSISSSMLNKGGRLLQEELWKKYPRGIQEFEFAVSNGYKLACKLVFHAACGRYNGSESETKFQSLIFECLTRANDFGMTSIVFPAIGAGILQYPHATVVKLLHSAVSHFSGAYPERSLQSVKCVVYDKRTYDSFKLALDTLLRGGHSKDPRHAIRDAPPLTTSPDHYAATRDSSTAFMHTSSYSHTRSPLNPRASLQGTSYTPWQSSVPSAIHQARNQTWDTRTTATQGYSQSSSSLTAHRSASYVPGVGAGSRLYTPEYFQYPTHSSTAVSYPHASSTGTTPQSRAHSSRASKGI